MLGVGIGLLLFLAYYTNPTQEDFIKYGIYRENDPQPLSFPASIESHNKYLYSTYGYKGFNKSGTFTGLFGMIFHTGGSSMEDIDYEWRAMDSTSNEWHKSFQADSVYKASQAKH